MNLKSALLLVSLLCIVVTFNIFQLRSQNQNLEYRFNTLLKAYQNNESPLSESEKQQGAFKEDYYITQLGSYTTLTLWFIAALLTVFGFIAFVNFKFQLTSHEKDTQKALEAFNIRLNNIISDNDIKHDNHIASYVKLEHSLLSFNAKIGLTIGKDYIEKALDTKNIESQVIQNYLLGIVILTDSYSFYKSDNNAIYLEVLKASKLFLSALEDSLNTVGKIDVLNKEITLAHINTIRTVFNDSEIDIMLANILTRFHFR